MKNKKYFYLIGVVLLIIILLVLIFKNTTKNSINGNNMNSQEIVDYILNINSYKAQVTIQVNSNKNTNKYVIKQEYNTENGCVQEVLEPSNIAGVRITRKDQSLIIENTNLNLSKMLNNYKGLEDNSLDLSNFIQEYKANNESTFEQKDNEIIMTTASNNKYNKIKVLYIDKEHVVPTRLQIKDDNQNTTIIIEYNNIELN